MDNNNLLYPELSYQIIGFAFEVFNELGKGHKEKIYHKAMANLFRKSKITFQSELYHPVIFNDENLEKDYFDFMVDNKIVVELKRSDYFSKSHFDQLNHYLDISRLQLGLLISFTSKGVRFKRVVNIK